MGMIDRYKKTGGFVQLLKLIETCGPAKQEKFLSIIEQESPNWAEMIKKKMLSMERILGWPDEVLAEVFSGIQELTLAVALNGIEDKDKERIFKTFSHGQVRRITGIQQEKNHSDAETVTAHMKIVEEMRRMISEHELKVAQFDADLVIEEDIEDLLAKHVYGMGLDSGESVASEVAASLKQVNKVSDAPASQGNSQQQAMVKDLQAKLQALLAENSRLKGQISEMEDRLAQIQKIAA